MSVGVNRIGQASIPVRDLPRATSFYKDVLGLNYIWGNEHMAFFDCGGVRLLMGIAESPEYDHKSSIFYFDVDDIQASYSALKEQGVEFQGDPHIIGELGDVTVWMAFFSDSEGNVMAIQSEQPTQK